MKDVTPSEDGINLDMLAHDVNEVLNNDEYAIDVDQKLIRAALPAFLAALQSPEVTK